MYTTTTPGPWLVTIIGDGKGGVAYTIRGHKKSLVAVEPHFYRDTAEPEYDEDGYCLPTSGTNLEPHHVGNANLIAEAAAVRVKSGKEPLDLLDAWDRLVAIQAGDTTPVHTAARALVGQFLAERNAPDGETERLFGQSRTGARQVFVEMDGKTYEILICERLEP